MSEELYVDTKNSGVRLDKYLVSLYPHMTRGEIIRMIRSGFVEINGKKAKASYCLKGGEYLFLGEYHKKSRKLIPNRSLRLEIVDAQDDFVVINKQIGIQVHPSHRERNNTIVNALIDIYPSIISVGDDQDRPGIVHRLDKDTTGLMIVAKTQKAFEELKKAFQQKMIQKTYHTIVFGHFDMKEGLVDAPIARATSYTKQKIAFGKYAGEAKEAQTAFRVVEEYMSGELAFSLVELRPLTGRMHQIRVHMAHIGHPLLGDQRYYTKNERKTSLDQLKIYDIHTFFLHAKELCFTYDGKNYVYKAAHPERFQALVKYLSQNKT